MFPAHDLVHVITDLQRLAVERWHLAPLENQYEGLLGLVCQQHQFNYLLWHEEDIARSPDVSDARIAEVKRAIDRYNQQRNDWIEKIDDHLMLELSARGVVPASDRPWNSETPGSAVDRLSILALRIYHLQEQLDRSDASPEHRSKVTARLAVAHRQHADLSHALAELLDDLFAGRKQLKLYRQMKMYNDPSMNPYLYAAKEQPHRKAG